MGKIKGLIINGEWLGNNLIVTPALQELNNISQVIVKEFIIKINEFNKEEEYQIVSYSFVSSDTILINFDSTNYVGAVEMQFAKQGATIVLIDSKVRVSNKNQINDDNLQKRTRSN